MTTANASCTVHRESTHEINLHVKGGSTKCCVVPAELWDNTMHNKESFSPFPPNIHYEEKIALLDSNHLGYLFPEGINFLHQMKISFAFVPHESIYYTN